MKITIDDIIHHTGGSGTVLLFDGNTFKQTPTLDNLAIKVCTICGYLQPIEIVECKRCGRNNIYISAANAAKLTDNSNRKQVNKAVVKLNGIDKCTWNEKYKTTGLATVAKKDPAFMWNCLFTMPHLNFSATLKSIIVAEYQKKMAADKRNFFKQTI